MNHISLVCAAFALGFLSSASGAQTVPNQPAPEPQQQQPTPDQPQPSTTQPPAYEPPPPPPFPHYVPPPRARFYGSARPSHRHHVTRKVRHHHRPVLSRAAKNLRFCKSLSHRRMMRNHVCREIMRHQHHIVAHHHRHHHAVTHHRAIRQRHATRRRRT